MKKIINNEELEKGIRAVEKVLVGYDNEDTGLILGHVTNRLRMQKVRQNQSELTDNAISRVLPKSLRKMLQKEKDEEGD
jgi:hypothetical protein